MRESTQKDTRYKNFFSTLKAEIRNQSISAPQKPTAEDVEFDNAIEKAIAGIH